MTSVQVINPDNVEVIQAPGEGGPPPSPIISVLEFGATGDGVTDDTGAMQRAHDSGELIYYPSGNYKFSKIEIPAGGIVGAGAGPRAGGGFVGTRLFTTDNSSEGKILWTGGQESVPLFRDFLLSTEDAAVKAGSGIKISPPSDESALGRFNNVTVHNIATGMHFERASHYAVSQCLLSGYTVAGVIIENLNEADSGDSSITQTQFFGATGTGILQHSSGGLKVSLCKFLGGTRAYWFEQIGQASTSILLFSNNSIEAQTSGGMVFSRTSGVNGFGKIIICANELALDVPSIFFDATVGAWNNLAINGNFIQNGTAGQKSIWLGAVSNFTIVGNTLFGQGTGDVGILTEAGCDFGKVGGNLICGYATTQTIGGTNVSTAF